MDNFDEYINKMDNITPKREVVKSTIDKIKEMEKEKNEKKVRKLNKMNVIKKSIIGAIAGLSISASCFATYVAVSGNTAILEKIGIKLSKNYEEQSQVVNQSISDEKVDITLESIGIDNSFLVVKYKINTKKELNKNVKLNVNSIQFYNEQIESYVFFKYEDNQIVSKNEDGSYTLYDICYINDVENANIESKYAVDKNEIPKYSGDLISYIFGEINEYGNKKYLRDNVELLVDVTGIETENGELVSGATESNDWSFKCNVNRFKDIGKSLTSEEAKVFNYNDLEITINRITEGSFGTSIMVTVSEDMYEEATNNDIEYVDVVVKDQNGKIMNIIAKHEELSTFGLYDRADVVYGKMFSKYIVVDANESISDYNIDIVKRSEKQRNFEF